MTYTAGRKYPGVQGPRHWPRSAPDGSQIAVCLKDDAGRVQLWTTSPNGGEPRQLTRNAFDVESAFSWSPHGKSIAFLGAGRVCVADVPSGRTRAVTAEPPADQLARGEACVFSPDGRHIAFANRFKKLIV